MFRLEKSDHPKHLDIQDFHKNLRLTQLLEQYYLFLDKETKFLILSFFKPAKIITSRFPNISLKG